MRILAFAVALLLAACSNVQVVYQDADGDGFGNSAERSWAYSNNVPQGWTVLGKFDCNDDDASVYPHALEIQDGLDNDCDGDIDEINPDQTHLQEEP